jgi:hypothetical protein
MKILFHMHVNYLFGKVKLIDEKEIIKIKRG